MDKELFITDQRMLQLMEHAVNIMKLANSEQAFMEQIGFTPTNINNVRKGTQGFSKTQILKACEITGASADYIFGLTDQMKRKQAKDPLDRIKQAVSALEAKRRRRASKTKVLTPKNRPYKKGQN